MFRKKEHPELYFEPEKIGATHLVLVGSTNNQLQLHDESEPQPKTQIVIKEDYLIDEEPGETVQHHVNLNIGAEKKSFVTVKFDVDENDDNSNDPYCLKKKKVDLTIDEETQKMINEMSKEVELERRDEEKKKIQKEHL